MTDTTATDEADKRVRCSTSKPVNLGQLTAEVGYGLCSGSLDDLAAEKVEVEIVVADPEAPVTDADLRAAVDAHVAVFPLSADEVLAAAVKALPDPTKDFAGFQTGLLDLLRGGR